MQKLGLGRLDTGDKPDIFDGVFKDHSIDIRTGELLGRYIAEERDSARLLRCCHEALEARGSASRPAGSADDDRLASLESKLDAVCAAIGEIQGALVTAAAPTNGSGRAKRTNGARTKTKA
jgi:hypothetical protein